MLFTWTIRINKENVNLNGTYLIKYFNASINIDGKLFMSKTISENKPLPAILQPKAINSKTEAVLSLELMKNFQDEEIAKIKLIKTQNVVFLSINCIFMITVITITLSVMVRLKKRRTTEISIEKMKF